MINKLLAAKAGKQQNDEAMQDDEDISEEQPGEIQEGDDVEYVDEEMLANMDL
jgi:hypothetical protein